MDRGDGQTKRFQAVGESPPSEPTAATIDREFEFYDFFSFLKCNEFYEFFSVENIRKKIVILQIIDV